MASNTKALVTGCLVAIALVALLVVVVIASIAIVFSSSTSTETDAFNLHVNPADPVILSVQTVDGDTIYMLGNKTSDGLSQSIDEFRVENEDGTTYVSMDTNGSISSASNSDGLQLDFIWGENFTTLHVSLVLGNGSEQVSINIDLSEPIDDNFTDFEDEDNVESKRSTKNWQYMQQDNIDVYKRSGKVEQTKNSKTKRQSENDNQNFANVVISVISCDMPELDAKVFADVLLGYNENTGSSDGSMRYTAIQTQVPGQYQVRIPTSAASDIGDSAGMICDKIEMILGKICDIYSKVNDFVKLFSKHEADSVICFGLGKGLKLAFPLLRIVPVYRFCKTAFKGVKTYCNIANKDLVEGLTPAKIICDALPLVDNGIDFLQQEKVLFTPSAFFPQGNTVSAEGRVLNLSPGSSTVNELFNVENDITEVRISHFNVFPFDPAPRQNYVVTVSYQCYSTNLLVSMTIIGTDKYTGHINCLTGPSCTLFVPGAEALVQDYVTVTVQDTVSTIVRRIIIIF